MSNNFYDEVYAVVRRIPAGQVTSYGRIAHMLGRPRAARAVGYALNALEDGRSRADGAAVPWQRVVNSVGRISLVNRENSALHQAELLRAEGVLVTAELTLDMDKCLWPGLTLWELDEILGETGR
ncbi:MAG: MGMT family protein [Chloroflexi bacterium]|nr:MGMT family protein [Chloroflexota bacterium]